MPEDIIRIGNVEIISLSDADLSFPAADFSPPFPRNPGPPTASIWEMTATFTRMPAASLSAPRAKLY